MAMMGEVTPNGNWNVATDATVVYNSVTYENIPIERFPYTDADIAAHKRKYPKGVVVLNQQPLPSNNEPIELPVEVTAEILGTRMNVQKTPEFPHGFVTLFV